MNHILALTFSFSFFFFFLFSYRNVKGLTAFVHYCWQLFSHNYISDHNIGESQVYIMYKKAINNNNDIIYNIILLWGDPV